MVLSVALGMAGVARADDAPAQAAGAAASAEHEVPAGYAEAIGQALAEYDAGRWDEARSLFLRAHALYPNARSFRGLGMVEFERGNYRASAEYLDEALRCTERPLGEALRAQTLRLLERARSFLARVELEVTPATVRVSIDGVSVDWTPGHPLILDVGDHIVELQAPGYLSEKRSLSIAGGERIALRVALVGAQQDHAAPRSEAAPRWYQRWWVWTSVGALIAGAVVGIAVVATRPPKKVVDDPVEGNLDLGGAVKALRGSF